MGRHIPGLVAAIATALVVGCTPAADRAPAAHAASPTPPARTVATVAEAFVSPLTPADNIDSPATWRTPDGQIWLIATAKATDKLVVYDGSTGRHLRDVGATGTGLGQFDRPNGIAVTDDLLWIVERDNHRVLSLIHI